MELSSFKTLATDKVTWCWANKYGRCKAWSRFGKQDNNLQPNATQKITFCCHNQTIPIELTKLKKICAVVKTFCDKIKVIN